MEDQANNPETAAVEQTAVEQTAVEQTAVAAATNVPQEGQPVVATSATDETVLEKIEDFVETNVIHPGHALLDELEAKAKAAGSYIHAEFAVLIERLRSVL